MRCVGADGVRCVSVDVQDVFLGVVHGVPWLGRVVLVTGHKCEGKAVEVQSCGVRSKLGAHFFDICVSVMVVDGQSWSQKVWLLCT